MKEMCVEAGVTPFWFGNCSDNQPNAPATATSAQPEAALVAGLQKVVDEADQAEAHHHEEHEQCRGRNRFLGEPHSTEIADQHTKNDDDATHCRGAALGVVALRPVVTNELAPAQLLEKPNEQRGQKEGEGERKGTGQ
jgi:hypothetical protein